MAKVNHGLMRPKWLLLLFLTLRVIPCSFSQPDTVKSDLSFDLGLTRGRNVNLWPVFKKYRDDERKELQVLYPLFVKTVNYKTPSKQIQVIPFYIGDSNNKGTDKRLVSLYYPSLVHLNKQYRGNVSISGFKLLEFAPGISLLGISRAANGLIVENNMFFSSGIRKIPSISRHVSLFSRFTGINQISMTPQG